ncbi:MAG: hypothetical protein WC718_16960 [Phycisphaerales bacterium]|jgi:hypothetical protein
MSTFGKKDAASKILADESGSKGHTIKKHTLQSPATGGKGISQAQLVKRTDNKMTRTVSAFTKPAGVTKAVKTAMNDPSYKPGTAQSITVPLTPHKSTGKLPSVMVASQNKKTGVITAQKVAAKSATVEFNNKGELFRVKVTKPQTQPQTARTTPKPLVKPPAQTFGQMANKLPKPK